MIKVIRLVYCYFCCLFSVALMAQEPVILGSGGNVADITVNTSSEEAGESAENLINENGRLPNLNSTSRFLTQSTFGTDYETIEATSGLSFNDWIDQQMLIQPAFKLKDFIEDLNQMAIDSIAANGGVVSEFKLKQKHFYFAWTTYMMESPDLLRNRVALALSEIFVLSENPDLRDYPRGLGDYYDMLLANAFGNYRDLLRDVSLHPGMGLYLTHLNNPKTDIDANVLICKNIYRIFLGRCFILRN